MKKSISPYFGWIAGALMMVWGCQEPDQDRQPSHAVDKMQVEEISTIKFLFGGDIMAHLPQIQAAYQREYDSYDFNNNYKYIKHLVQDADIAVANLETTIPGKGPYRGYPQFSAPADLLAALKNTGFDVLCTANNHANDTYGRGLRSTIKYIELYSMAHVGTYFDIDHRDSTYPLVVEKNDIKVAFLNHTYSTNGIPDTDPTLVNRIDTAEIRTAFLRAKAQNADYIIACMHWGLEYKLQESVSQRKTAQFLADLGVDLIVGSHPHVIQPIKFIQTSKGDSILCAYSLGNLISNQQYPNTDGGLLLEVTIQKDHQTGQTSMVDYGHHIHWRYKAPATAHSPKGEYYILPQGDPTPAYLDELKPSPAVLKNMQSFTTRMRNHLSAHPAAKEIRAVSYAEQ